MPDPAIMRTGAETIQADKQGQTWEPWPEWELSPPPEGHPHVGKWVHEHFQVMRRHRDALDLPQLWLHFHELYRNRIFRTKSKYTQVPANLYFKTINTLKANLTDNKPRASIMPRGDTADNIADGWQAAYDYWWDNTKQQYCLQESVGKSELYGYQTDQMLFNPELNGGLGEIETKRLDTFGYLTWPGHPDHQTAPMVCCFEAMELGDIYRDWPEQKDKVKAEPEYSELLGESRITVRGTRSKQLRPIGAPPGFYFVEEDDRTSMQQTDVKRALVIELWARDYTMIMVDPRTGEEVPEGTELPPEQTMQPVVDPTTGQPVIDPQTKQPTMQTVAVPVEPVQQSKYPGFLRRIRVTNGGKIVLDDMPNPSINPTLPREIACETYLWDHYPFIKRLSYSDDISEFGLSIMEQIEPLVMEVSKKLTQYGVHLDTQCKSPLILPQGCGVKRSQVSNLPGRIWEPIQAYATYIRFLQPPAVSGDVVAYIRLLVEFIDAITGLTDVSEGRRPVGITAGTAIAQLQEKAQTILREKIRNLDLYLEEQGRMFISLGQNWYTYPRMLRYEGKQDTQIFEFRGTHYQGDVAFEVEAGSTLPRNRALRHQNMLELGKARMISLVTLLKEMGVPNADEEAAKVQAGPLGIALQKLSKTGLFDEATLKAIQQVLTMPDRDFKKAFPQVQSPFLPQKR